MLEFLSQKVFNLFADKRFESLIISTTAYHQTIVTDPFSNYLLQ